jgi:hypothetical protein
MIKSHLDVVEAYDSGRYHVQRFIKTGAGQSTDARWQDWAFQAGQPAYDARVGPVNALVPCVASKNDSIYFPDIPAGMERKLHKLTMIPKASNASQASIDFVLCDLVAYYPLIDGDSSDPQDLDNTLTLPRYADGEGLQLVMVNHVAPQIQGGRMLLDYTDSKGISHTVDRNVTWAGINCAVSGLQASTASPLGPLTVSLDGGVTGIRSVERVTFTTVPGGLFCLYLVKPLATFTHYHDALVQADTTGSKHALEVDFALKDGWRMPTIKDGAHLMFFYRGNGGLRSNTFFGDATFIWN